MTICEDPSVLPAAGAGGTAAGADFHDASVDPLRPNENAGLLPPEELPGLNFTITEAPVLAEEAIPPEVSGHLRFIVEEEELHVVREENPEFNSRRPATATRTPTTSRATISARLPAMTRTSTAISRKRRSSSAATSPAWFPAVGPFTSMSATARTARR